MEEEREEEGKGEKEERHNRTTIMDGQKGKRKRMD